MRQPIGGGEVGCRDFPSLDGVFRNLDGGKRKPGSASLASPGFRFAPSGLPHRVGGYSRNSLVSSPMPSIATVTMFTGSFITPTPTEVPTAMRSPGSRVMSWEILLTSSCAEKIMSDIG